MNYPLAVFAPDVGLASETFITRHIRDLLPRGAVAITRALQGDRAKECRIDCPVLLLSEIRRKWEGRARRFARRLGMPVADDMSLVVAERFLKKHKVKVVLGEYLDWSLTMLPVAQDLGIRFFGHAHGYDVSLNLREDKWQTEYLRYNSSDGIIAVSHASRDRLNRIGISDSKVHVIPCGVDIPSGPTQRPRKDCVNCLAVGRMVAKKAPILTLDAFRRAAKVCPNLRLDYVGAGPLLPAAQQFVHALELGEMVTLHGSQPNENVQQLMREADIFLQHSMIDPNTGDEEGLPVAILEAMAQSLPVVSTRHAGIPEAVICGSSGYLVEEGNCVSMAERIITLVQDFDLRRRFGLAGWELARDRFSWQKEQTELLKVMGLKS